jgi:hypothetical protein
MINCEQLRVSPVADSTLNQPRGSRPQLRLRHLFVFTAVAAVLLAIFGRQLSNLDNLVESPLLRAIVIGDEVIRQLLNAASVTAAGYCIAWRLLGAEVFRHPGHWLLVVMAASIVAMLGNGLVSRWWFASQSFDMPWRAVAIISLLIPNTFFTLGPWILSLYIGITKCSQRRWKLVFVIYVAANVMQILVSWVSMRLDRAGLVSFTTLYYASSLTSVGCQMIVLVYAIIIDRQERVPRDAIHWCGVCLYAATSLASWVLSLGWWLLT